jgi:hypothetical protein
LLRPESRDGFSQSVGGYFWAGILIVEDHDELESLGRDASDEPGGIPCRVTGASDSWCAKFERLGVWYDY